MSDLGVIKGILEKRGIGFEEATEAEGSVIKLNAMFAPKVTGYYGFFACLEFSPDGELLGVEVAE